MHKDVIENMAYAFGYAAHAAINQKRKYSGIDYFTHPCAVRDIVSKYSYEFEYDSACLAAAYLHDVVEDTEVTIEQIYYVFGEEIGNMVKGLTSFSQMHNYKELGYSRAARKKLDTKFLSDQSREVQYIKVADIKHNTSDLNDADPFFALQYLKEKIKVMDKLIKVRHFELYKDTYSQLLQLIDVVKKNSLLK